MFWTCKLGRNWLWTENPLQIWHQHPWNKFPLHLLFLQSLVCWESEESFQSKAVKAGIECNCCVHCIYFGNVSRKEKMHFYEVVCLFVCLGCGLISLTDSVSVTAPSVGLVWKDYRTFSELNEEDIYQLAGNTYRDTLQSSFLFHFFVCLFICFFVFILLLVSPMEVN